MANFWIRYRRNLSWTIMNFMFQSTNAWKTSQLSNNTPWWLQKYPRHSSHSQLLKANSQRILAQISRVFSLGNTCFFLYVILYSSQSYYIRVYAINSVLPFRSRSGDFQVDMARVTVDVMGSFVSDTYILSRYLKRCAEVVWNPATAVNFASSFEVCRIWLPTCIRTDAVT